MARKCNVCDSKKLDEINEKLVASTPIAVLSRNYGITWDSLKRHKQNHLPKALKESRAIQEVTRADNLLDQIEELRTKAISLLTKAENAGDLKTALQGIGQARACLELLAKIRGELAQEGTVNIMISAEWIELRSIILQVLEPYPKARQNLLERLNGVKIG